MPKKVNSKKTRDPERTKQALLDAARSLFALRGYDGVSVDEIVAQAKCNKRMAYHYFGNKDGLYTAVLREVFGKLESYELETTQEVTDTETAIRDILARYFDFLQGNPDFVNLLMWENLTQARFLESHPNLLSKAPILERLQQILSSAVNRGEISNKHDTRHILILLIGVCFIYFSNRHTLAHSLKLNLSRPSIIHEGLQVAQDVILYGLLRPSR